MNSQAKFQNPNVPAGLKASRIAMELARTSGEVRDLANIEHNKETFQTLQIG